ncbi:MAG: ATP-dependent zinc metalloprotease FtsH [Sphingomonadaceae bacterium]
MNDDNNQPTNPWMKSLLIWIAVLLAVGTLVSLLDNRGSSTKTEMMAYSDFLAKVDDGSVKEVVDSGTMLTGRLQNGDMFRLYAVNDPNLVTRLSKAGVRFSAQPPEGPSLLMLLLSQALPFLLILGVGFFIMRQMQKGAGSGAMGFGKSRAKMLTEKQGRVTFEDVAGIDEAREELEEIVDFLRDPTKFSRLGGKIPKGALLVGSPGTGKTLLARAIAGEAKVPFFTISGSDFVEMFVGVGASRVRDMFEQAKKSSPCIVFIDEIDAVGRHRGSGIGNGNDEREQTLNQLLVEMDGFEANEAVIIIAATNRPDVLDPALLRPGRFDRQINVPLPDIEGRKKILAVHMNKIPLAPDVDTGTLARGTPGFSGAELANLVNEAALLAARLGKRLVAMGEFEEAKDKVYMGVARRSMVMTQEEKASTACHEAGHALVSIHVEGNDPLHKVTIIPRGRALGVTWNLPERDTLAISMKQMKAKLALAYGGRIAEQLIYGEGELNTGASSDIDQATNMARAMVTQYGMSKKLGWLRYQNTQTDYISQDTARLIDDEVRALIEEAEGVARKVLTDNLDQLKVITDALLEYETLSGEEVNGLLEGNKPDRNSGDSGKPKSLGIGGSSIPKTRKPTIGGAAPSGA